MQNKSPTVSLPSGLGPWTLHSWFGDPPPSTLDPPPSSSKGPQGDKKTAPTVRVPLMTSQRWPRSGDGLSHLFRKCGAHAPTAPTRAPRLWKSAKRPLQIGAICAGPSGRPRFQRACPLHDRCPIKGGTGVRGHGIIPSPPALTKSTFFCLRGAFELKPVWGLCPTVSGQI